MRGGGRNLNKQEFRGTWDEEQSVGGIERGMAGSGGTGDNEGGERETVFFSSAP